MEARAPGGAHPLGDAPGGVVVTPFRSSGKGSTSTLIIAAILTRYAQDGKWVGQSRLWQRASQYCTFGTATPGLPWGHGRPEGLPPGSPGVACQEDLAAPATSHSECKVAVRANLRTYYTSGCFTPWDSPGVQAQGSQWAMPPRRCNNPFREPDVTSPSFCYDGLLAGCSETCAWVLNP